MSGSLSYSLGADDISKIVDAILPPLSPFLPNLTKDAQYVLLHKNVLDLSKGKTYSNASSLDLLVNDIVDNVFSNIVATPDDYCTSLPNFDACTANTGCAWLVNDIVTDTGGYCYCVNGSDCTD